MLVLRRCNRTTRSCSVSRRSSSAGRCFQGTLLKALLCTDREGVLRVGAASYDLEDISNTHAHLSNHCLAVDHPDYGKYEPTNELWYSQFDAWLQKTRGKRFEEAILPQIRHITVHTLLAAKEELENADPQRDACVSFQLCEIQILGSCLGYSRLCKSHHPSCAIGVRILRVRVGCAWQGGWTTWWTRI